MKVKEIGPDQIIPQHESDITNISNSEDGLTILIDTVDKNGDRRTLKVYFKYSAGFRYLDEGDLAYYWATDTFESSKHVFKILSGGWSNGETLEPGILDMSKVTEISEWFIATSNGCINVLSNIKPVVEYV